MSFEDKMVQHLLRAEAKYQQAQDLEQAALAKISFQRPEMRALALKQATDMSPLMQEVAGAGKNHVQFAIMYGIAALVQHFLGTQSTKNL